VTWRWTRRGGDTLQSYERYIATARKEEIGQEDGREKRGKGGIKGRGRADEQHNNHGSEHPSSKTRIGEWELSKYLFS
jgi:hypothetical protein